MSMFKTTMERSFKRCVCNFLTWEGVAAIAAVTAVGLTAYGMATAPGAPEYQAPPPPPNSTVYGEDGSVMSRQVFDKDKNEWITYSGTSEPQKPKEVADPGPMPTSKIEMQWTGGENPVETPVEVGASPEDIAVWETKKNEYDKYQKDLAEYQPKYDKWAADKAQQTADKQTLAEMRSQTLNNLNETPADRIAAYDKYAEDFAVEAHRTADPQYEKMVRNEEERSNATGMMGSRAYVDTKAEMADIKTQQDVDISTQSALAKEQLMNNDRNYWMALLNQIDSGQRADTLATIQTNKAASDINSQNYAGTLGYYTATNNNKMAEWEANRQRSAAYTSAGTGMANGLLYLYGGMKGGSAPASSTGSSFNIQPAKTQAGTFSLFK